MAQPEWTLGSDTVLRSLRLIEAGYLNDHSAAELARQVQVGERQLSRLFSQELGASPRTVAALCRAGLARSLLLATRLPHAEVAYHAGYGSVSRFNDEIRKVYGCAPGSLRRGGTVAGPPHLELLLPVRGPYDFNWIFQYLSRRALRGIEQVSGAAGSWRFQRQLESGGCVSISQADGGLRVQLPLDGGEPVHALLVRVRRLFDLNADGAAVHEFLLAQPELADLARTAPGLRVPGAWDGFELAVRAVLGQQVSVARGTALADAMVDRYGSGGFPSPHDLMHRDIAELGMPGRRGRAIAELARHTAAGRLQVDECQDFDELQRDLEAIDGIGPWTANYIRMRAARDPDAFPDNDWVVLKQLGGTAAQARRTAAAWRPWRAYALMYLWYRAALAPGRGKEG